MTSMKWSKRFFKISNGFEDIARRDFFHKTCTSFRPVLPHKRGALMGAKCAVVLALAGSEAAGMRLVSETRYNHSGGSVRPGGRTGV